MSENQQPNLQNSDLVDKKAFITHTDVDDIQNRLAHYEIQMPSGPYNVEFETAKERLQTVTDQLKRTQHEYDLKMQELDSREASLNIRKAELLRRQQEVEAYVARSIEREKRSQQVTDKRCGDIASAVNEISRLTDNIAGATALLSVLQERNSVYKVYSDFVEGVYLALAGAQFKPEDALSANAKRHEAIRHQHQCQDFVFNIFTRLKNEEQQSIDLEAKLHQQYDELAEKIRERQAQNRQIVAELEQKIAELSQELDQLVLKKDMAQQDSQQLNIKLHAKTQELSAVSSSVKNLVQRIQEFKEQRHDFLTDRASIDDILGGKNTKLESQVDSYFQKSKGLVDRSECYKRVLGEGLLERLKDIYKLGLFLNDFQELVRICKGDH
ncbi:hypothetical protein SS50377_20857 [Spironucleus salmonicida]|uniref:DUF4200 domain-containing protein n=1 Tax=Spironucleus salmonicida TaxID=348837 RepID=V6LG52_9EUKA|nr:hypothetical protein SS50377_20857 [Spironucleus salmonicida]|eukprot:EST43535.1 Hypothetical protein SS50377_16570 [Spironucleus salmonicida]